MTNSDVSSAALNRRGFLGGMFGVACSAASSPLLTPVSVAAAPGENRLVVVILRGAMDGLGVVSPYGERGFAALRPTLAATPDNGLIDLDGQFGLHDRLSPLMPLWTGGEMAFVHAVSTPYRGKRSHFDGQDILEAGEAAPGRSADGWLNRALPFLGANQSAEAIAVGRENMLLLRGQNPSQSWSPDANLSLENDDRALLQMLYANDPLFADAAATADFLSRIDQDDKVDGVTKSVAAYTAQRLNAEARIAAFSVGGWDTHARQANALNRPLRELTTALTALREGLGANWGRTLVIAMTEFGRTARENGNKGTDHGTGSAAILAGGAVLGGKVYGSWPGLKSGDLYDDRDLMPTRDVRVYPAWALSALYGVERSAVEQVIFPGLDMGSRPDFIA